MPIYEPKDYEKVIARIQKKVLARNIKVGERLSEKVMMNGAMPLAGSIAPFVVSSPFHGLRVVPWKLT